VGGGCILIGSAKEYEAAIFAWKIAHIGIIFIPPTLYHTVGIFCKKLNVRVLVFGYLQAIVFLCLNFADMLYSSKLVYVFNQFYYIKSNLTYNIFFITWGGLWIYTTYLLCVTYIYSSDIKRKQIPYFFVGTIVGFSGGLVNFFEVYNIHVYPLGNFLLPLYPILVTYAIFRYRLMDISIVITRTGIFIAVYSFILGIPFALAFGLNNELSRLIGVNWWIVPLLTSTILSTIGPFLYLYFQKRAEDSLLQEQRQYQSTLQQASSGMGQVKDLQRLLNLIVRIVTRTVRIEHCSIFLFNEQTNNFVIKASNFNASDISSKCIVAENSYLVTYLKKKKAPIIFQEIKQIVEDYGGNELRKIVGELADINAELLVPSFIENRIIALIVLGNKKSGKLYSEDDLAVFSILANQSGLAIENAQFFEDMKKTQEKLFRAEKMATIGTMADGLSHQINNRLHTMGFIAGDIKDTINIEKNRLLSNGLEDICGEIEYAVGRIEDNVKKGGEVVEGLLKYTRKTDEGFTDVDLNQLIDATLEMIKYKIKLDEIDIVRNFSDETPKFSGNFTQLQEVFFNIIDNAYDAIVERRVELKESNFRGVVEIFAIQQGNNMEIRIRDNGMGVKRNDLKKLFTPFFTTKIASKKGTGLGLYVIRQIIESNHRGRVLFDSEYKKGSETKIVMPMNTSMSASTS